MSGEQLIRHRECFRSPAERPAKTQFRKLIPRRTSMRRSFLCAILVLAAALAARADQVTLKNGDRLTGSIVNSDGKTLLIKTEFAGDVTVQWDAITGIESSGKLNLTLKDGKRLSGK